MYKTALIIGASSGIGKELAIALVKKNYLVVITGRRLNLLLELKNKYPDNFIISDFDISNVIETNDKLNKIKNQLEKIDLLILSSGAGEINYELNYNIEKKITDVNVMGFTLITNWAINLFKKQKYGHLVAITSIAGLLNDGGSSAYCASKAFQINYLKGLRKKIRKLKIPIYITDVRAGYVDTQMAKGKYKFWVAPVEKASKQILVGIKNKRKNIYITKRWRIIALLIKIFYF